MFVQDSVRFPEVRRQSEVILPEAVLWPLPLRQQGRKGKLPVTSQRRKSTAGIASDVRRVIVYGRDRGTPVTCTGVRRTACDRTEGHEGNANS